MDLSYQLQPLYLLERKLQCLLNVNENMGDYEAEILN
jgi:hypothetical protein